MYHVPVDEFEGFNHFHGFDGFGGGGYRQEESSFFGIDAAILMQCLVFGIMALFFYLSANMAAVDAERARHSRQHSGAADDDDDGDDDDGIASEQEDLTAASSIRELKYECARRGMDISGCTEKGDLLRLLGISVAVEDDDDGVDSVDEVLDPTSSIMALKYECARRSLDVSGCAEKADLLRLLGIPVPAAA